MAETREYVVLAPFVGWIEDRPDGKGVKRRQANRGKVVELDEQTAAPMVRRGKIREHDGSPVPEPPPAPPRSVPHATLIGTDGPRSGPAALGGEPPERPVPDTTPVAPLTASYAELLAMKLSPLRELADQHGIEIENGDRKADVARKLADANVVVLDQSGPKE